ncbi:fimbrial protein [Burkholderia anthina]|uniref:Fimbria adhesin protein n=1 Tax=Burkholderia anthina TaxID=179879 RepID=A0A6P2GCQ6_9BURK|nr:fimbrial protein [Burkholderia anthina]MBM2769078.1 type 1 fimbrial protein [Burkholderia anthina]VVU51552.1 fimbria adhesin protein [Burkholderia anthina]
MTHKVCKADRRKMPYLIHGSFGIIRYSKMAGVAVAFMVASKIAHADCTINPNYPVGQYTFSAGTINLLIDPNLKVGDQIGDTRTFPMPEWSGSAGLSQYTAVQCDAGSVEEFAGTTEYDPVTQTYKLPNIEGIGYQLSYPAKISTPQVPSVLAPIKPISNPHTPGHMVYPPASQGQPLTLKFIKTGDIKGGTAPMQKYGSGGVTSPIIFEALSLSFGVTAQEPTCNINNSNIRVSMAKSNVSDFNGIGSSPSGKRQPFDINMTCNSAVSQLKIQFDSQYAHNGMTGVIDLTDSGANTASGIGIRMRYGANDEPVPLGQQLDITTMSLESGTLPMSAEYVQTGDTVKAGIANSVATFSIEYQ